MRGGFGDLPVGVLRLTLYFVVSVPRYPPDGPFVSAGGNYLLRSVLMCSTFDSSGTMAPPTRLADGCPSSSRSEFVVC